MLHVILYQNVILPKLKHHFKVTRTILMIFYLLNKQNISLLNYFVYEEINDLMRGGYGHLLRQLWRIFKEPQMWVCLKNKYRPF